MQGIRIEGVKKVYNEHVVLDDININITKPGIYLIAGPNGSGKTTLLEIIVGLRKQTAGNILIQGFSPSSIEAKKEIGFLSQQNSLRKSCYVNEEIDLIIELFHLKDVNPVEYLSKYGLDQYYKYKTKKLSGGTKRRLLLAMTFLTLQSIVILDEPVSGLDTFSRNEIWNMITEFANERIILVSDHYLNQAAMYCDYVYLMNEGKIIVSNDVKHIMNSLPMTHVIKARKGKHSDLEKLLREVGFNIDAKVSGTVYNYYVSDSVQTPVNLIPSGEYVVSKIDFEDVYFYYTGRYSSDGGDN